MADSEQKQNFLAQILSGGPATPSKGSVVDEKMMDLAKAMYERGKNITMKTRAGDKMRTRLWLALCANRTLALPGFNDLEESCQTMMELLVSHEGEGRKEWVQMAHATYNTTIGAVQPIKDPALDG